jgi:hypothetical protein
MTASHRFGAQVRHPRVFTSFKPAKAASKKEREQDALREAHLAAVRRLWCVITCDRRLVEAHSLRSGPAKAEHGPEWVLPVSRLTHNHIEGLGSRNELAFFEERGFDPYALAAALWAVTPDVERMGKILEAHQDEARKTVERRKRQRFNPSVGDR